MKFRLSYEGELFATQRDALGEQPVPRAARKHAIRRRFHEQLKRYWDSNWILRNSKAGLSNHKAEDLPFIIDGGGADEMPLAEAIARENQKLGYRWVPLVRPEARLVCQLNIQLLRKDGRGSVFSDAGDIDNRVKTLVDCLRVPRTATELVGNEVPRSGENPFFCLLSDDNLVTGISVEMDQLFDYPDDSLDTFVKLIIGVEIEPYSVGFDNLHYL